MGQILIGGVRLCPARFCAPLAGYTHSAFRRLAAEIGGCGAFWTEMLAARQVLSEDFGRSPWLRWRPVEGMVFHQLMVRADDPIERVLDRMEQHGVAAVDVNLACHAREIRSRKSGSALFEDLVALEQTIVRMRRHWPGVLTAKIRLGRQRPDWKDRFAERMRILAESGIDAVILHPRFFEEKFKRRARHELIPWAASLTRLPVIANGDLGGPDSVRQWGRHLEPAAGIMMGRMAVARPWLFAAWEQPIEVEPAAIWRRLYDYVLEDFEPAAALRRIQMFTKYFAANFQFGHAFRCAVGSAPSLEEARGRAEAFLAARPAMVSAPSVSGL
ncbi:MAG TPA: tRNA-dihydrouridine synthase family protein [Candidatus Paceibacterota bacterium]|nr:tRNA-dihydrouridine synthase family protein [Verrucomicrobiota bacterium]HOX01340.1 tRNA-dihydrouridine synthase family protein [Verrucomicrobiota bacterium]HRZ46504.1 tRNA-dihydrouridine synthase family protein [Candidatus Paceibacterota bacterium]HRZ93065.1 tRNA-dihydrouridine synthase family protein [Candidatus Paceibacterota bacterium]